MKRYFEKTLKNLVDIRVIGLTKSNASQRRLFKYDMYPERLYKYRSCDKKGFDAFEKNYVYSPLPSAYEDKQDSKVFLGGDYCHKGKNETTKICKSIAQKFWREHSRQLKSIGVDKKWLINALSNNVIKSYSIGKLRSDFEATISRLSKKEKKAAMAQFKKLVVDPIMVFVRDAEDVFSKITHIHRDNARVCCLTDSYDYKYLWENYADDYRGFVVEYTKPERKQIDSKAMNLMLETFPVEYFKKRQKIDISPILVDIINNRSVKKARKKSKAVLVEAQRQILQKRLEFEVEKEWRIILNDNENSWLGFPYATAVYCGYNIEENNFERIRRICDCKRLSLFRQRLDNDGMLYYERVYD